MKCYTQEIILKVKPVRNFSAKNILLENNSLLKKEHFIQTVFNESVGKRSF